jgi:hypothetical protein
MRHLPAPAATGGDARTRLKRLRWSA